MTKVKMPSRRAARARAFQVLYGLHFTPAASVWELRTLFAATPTPDDDDEDDAPVPVAAPAQTPGTAPAEALSPLAAAQGFAWELVQGVWTKADELDALIKQYSRNWRVDRMGRIELTLLRLGLFELVFRPDVPHRVAINEALELTAHFGDAKAKSFINGILDAVAKAQEAGTLNPDGDDLPSSAHKDRP